MTANDYQDSCLKTASPISMATTDNLLLQGVMGMSGEAGEAIDIVKKFMFQGHPLDEETKLHLAKEIGDVLWYAATASYAIGWKLEDVMLMNLNKLSARYKDGFSPEESLKRKAWDV